MFRKPLDGTVRENLRRWRRGGFRRPGYMSIGIEKDERYFAVAREAIPKLSQLQP